MLLILTNSKDVTADYLVGVLSQHDVPFLRLDTDSILRRITVEYDSWKPQIRAEGAAYSPELFSNVWYRRPEQLKLANSCDVPEGKFILEEWAEALEGFLAHIDESKWMNHPSRNVCASHKVEQLTRARYFGLSVPDTLVTQDTYQFRSFYTRHHGQVIAKPLATGYLERSTGQRDSLIYTNRVLPDHLAKLEDLSNCPTLFQEYVHKVSDVRITAVDSDIHATQLLARDSDGRQRCDIRRNNMDDVRYCKVTLPEAVEEAIRRLLAYYSLRFAAIDMAVTVDDEWVFFEVNPNGQWAWLDLAGATSIALSFVKAFNKK